VLRVVEVDVRLRSAVHEQRPGAGPVRIGHQLDASTAVRLDGRPGAVLLPMRRHNHQYRPGHPLVTTKIQAAQRVPR
jgi:hypothetical protein